MNNGYLLDQRGVVPLFVVILVVSLIGLGTYLVQQRTSFYPRAQGVTAGYCENGWEFLGGDAGDPSRWLENSINCEQPVDEDAATRQIRENDRIYCERECGGVDNCEGVLGAKYCKKNQGSQSIGSCQEKNSEWIPCGPNPVQAKNNADKGYPINNEGYMDGDVCKRKIYKWEDTLASGELCCSTPLTTAADQAECKRDAENTPGGGIVPSQSSGGSSNSCPDNGMIYCENQKSIEKYDGEKNTEGECEYKYRTLENNDCKEKDNGDVVKAGGGSSSSGGGTQPISAGGTVPACQEEVAINAYYNGKVATNLMHYYAITKGTPGRCVKADLGLAEHWYAQPLPEQGEDYRRLFMCSGSDGSTKWRVIGNDGQKLVQIRSDSGDLLTKAKEYAEKAEVLLNVKYE